MATETKTVATAAHAKPKSSSELMNVVADQRAHINVRVRSLGELFELNKESMFQALPEQMKPQRMINLFLGCVRKTPKLLNCKVESVINAMRNASDLGLEPGDALGFAYLVPYKDECVFLPGYKGLIDLCRRSGQVSTMYSEVVRGGDYFLYRRGDKPTIEHEPSLDVDRHKQPITHVYAVFRLRDGGVQWRVMSTPEINAHKEKHSQAWRYAEKTGKNDSTWHTDWEPMARKTVIRAMINAGEVPVSTEVQRLAGMEQKIESEVIDVESRPPRQVSGLIGLTDMLESKVEAAETVPDEPPRPHQAPSRPDTRAHETPHIHKPTEEAADAADEIADAPADFSVVMQRLQADLDAATTIKGCKVVGESYIRQYASTPEDTDAMVALVAQRQTALRDRTADTSSS